MDRAELEFAERLGTFDAGTSVISDSDIASYERDGVICLRQVIDPATVKTMLGASVDLLEHKRQAYADTLDRKTRMGDTATVANEPGRFFGGVFMTEESAVFRDFVMRSALPRAAATLMRSKVARFFYDQLFIKEPGTVSPTLWHHDMPFWPLTGTHLISCWVALTTATQESSGLEYVAGSHRWDKFYQATADQVRDETMEPAPNFSDPTHRHGHRFVSWDMEPGDVLFHHPLAVHGAGGNQSQSHRRVGLSIRYIGEDAQWAPRPKAMKLPRTPRVEIGAYPADDDAFPIAYRSP